MSVKSPHVNRVYELVGGASQSFVVLQDLPGQSLRDFLATPKMNITAACHIGFQTALGLVALHERGILHGSPTPENIWIERSGAVRLLQFPLVPMALDMDRFKPPTVAYLAPELHDAEQTPTVQTDLYSLGCTLYELIAGQRPFDDHTVHGVLRRHQSDGAQRLDKLMKGVPEALADLIVDLLEKDPLLRCASASHVAHLLAPFASGAKPRTATPPRLDTTGPLTGYGAWQAPAWAAPPRQTPSVVPKAQVAPNAPRLVQSPSTAAGAQPPRARILPRSGQVSLTVDGPKSAKVAVVPGASDPARKTPAGSATDQPQATEEPPVGKEIPRNFESPDDGASSWQPPENAGAPRPIVRPKTATSRFSAATLVAVGVGLALVAIVLIAGLMVYEPTDPADARAPTVPQGDFQSAAPAVSPATGDQQPAKVAGKETAEASKPSADQRSVVEVADDGQTLWAAPPGGRPLTLDYLPSGAQVILVLRPSELLAHAEGAKWLDALGPAGERMKNQLVSVLGVALSEIELLSIALTTGDSGAPVPAMTMRLRAAVPEATLLERWNGPQPVEHQGKKYFQGDRFAYYIPPSGQGRTIAIATVEAMKSIVEFDGAPLLSRGIEKLLSETDSARHITLLLVPRYLSTDGESLLAGELARLRDPLGRMFDEHVEALALSAQLADALFLELRAVGTADQPPQKLSQTLMASIGQLPDQVEQYVVSLNPQPYGRAILLRLPRMIQWLRDYTRAGVENRQAVLRCYLPVQAAHNLLLGTELALSEAPPAGLPTNPAASVAPRPTAAAALKKKISLSFPRDTLERCLEMFSKEIDVDVVINGSDLQLEGITKNQSFSLDERDQPASDILRKILKLASPAGKLVYVIRPRDGGSESIVITTRAAAAKRGDKLSES